MSPLLCWDKGHSPSEKPGPTTSAMVVTAGGLTTLDVTTAISHNKYTVYSFLINAQQGSWHPKK